MELVYRGKTKDVYERDAHSLHLVFTDRVTKNDAGEIDPGGNNLAEETVPGQGEACLLMTSAIFSEINAKNIARTHMISYDLPSLSMDVLKAKLFAPGLEWVTRWVCTGSFLRRYNMVPGVKDGMFLPSPVYEITLIRSSFPPPWWPSASWTARSWTKCWTETPPSWMPSAPCSRLGAWICGTSRSSGAWTNRAVP